MSALSPLDGRYAQAIQPIQSLWSEDSFIKHRLFIESEWVLALTHQKSLTQIPTISAQAIQALRQHIRRLDTPDFERVKSIEADILHDVKACEIYLRQWCEQDEALAPIAPFIHFACTSEDINNLAYSLMLKATIETVITPNLEALLATLKDWKTKYAGTPMLARTHGQPASPTTLGKEISVFYHRLNAQYQALKSHAFSGKMNGAVGNYHAHAASKQTDWLGLSEKFIETLGLKPTAHTTQIEPQDRTTDLYHRLHHINRILNDFSLDMWHYISLGYFEQRIQKNQVGSSTMPHKINPLRFENAEGNLALANTLFTLFIERLPCSRLQRDLSNSTILRNQGVALGHMSLALQNLQKGLMGLDPNITAMQDELALHWSVLAEPIQTILKLHGFDDAYEALRQETQGKQMSQTHLQQTLERLDVPDALREELLALHPAKYIGKAHELALMD